MFDAPLDLKNARILVTNDDGVETPGIELLEKIARGFSDDVWVVAPRWDNTGAGHSMVAEGAVLSKRVTTWTASVLLPQASVAV